MSTELELVIKIRVLNEKRLRTIASERMAESGHDTDPAEHFNGNLGELAFETLIGSNPDPIGPDQMGIEIVSWTGFECDDVPAGEATDATPSALPPQTDLSDYIVRSSDHPRLIDARIWLIVGDRLGVDEIDSPRRPSDFVNGMTLEQMVSANSGTHIGRIANYWNIPAFTTSLDAALRLARDEDLYELLQDAAADASTSHHQTEDGYRAALIRHFAALSMERWNA